MDGVWKGRRSLLLVVAVVAVFVSVAGVAAIAQPEAGDVFTGCLNETSGGLRNVAIGFEPSKPCNDRETPITWDRAGPAFEGRIADLEERVGDLEGRLDALGLFVDCAAGETIGAALASAEGHVGPVFITISGVCEENVFLGRDDVSFSGTERSDGVRGPTASLAVGLFDAHRVRFSNMTLSGGITAIFAAGSSFEADNITIRDSLDRGVVAANGSNGSIRDCIISGHPRFGVETETESVADIANCEITDNGDIGLFAGGVGSATIWVRNSYIARNESGLAANVGGNLRIQSSTIEQNTFGGVSAFGGEIVVSSEDDATRITNNGNGIGFSNGGNGVIENAIIENNDTVGVKISGGANVTVFDSIVRDNGGDGIQVQDLSTISTGFEGTTQIIDNGGWGVLCAGPPAVAVLGGQGLFNPADIDLSGNALGSTNCS